MALGSTKQERRAQEAALLKARATAAIHAKQGVFNVSPWPLIGGVIAGTAAVLFVLFMIAREHMKEQLRTEQATQAAPATEAPPNTDEIWIDVE